jgi:hypothetical protein
MSAMIRRSCVLRIFALFAAYVVALQVLLLPISFALGGTLDLIPCAASTSAESSHTPTSHQTGCPGAAGCGMQCCAHAFAPPPQPQGALDFTGALMFISLPTLVPAVRSFVRGPQLARAPPAA